MKVHIFYRHKIRAVTHSNLTSFATFSRISTMKNRLQQTHF